ncbi:MAG TPA: hypothetical protein VKT78_20530 [Fimbriimonadaceae bacterium]|nr:hypothetical protein [Fimbriimonadaceae bacterium]
MELEWSVVSGATDALQRDVRRYAPRIDIGIGPFNTAPGRDGAINEGLLPRGFCELFNGMDPNPNPRCLLAIEIVFNGSSKHIMGDMLNAGALGLYGIVVGAESEMAKIRRIGQYIAVLAQLEKLPPMFRNVVPMTTGEFDQLIR